MKKLHFLIAVFCALNTNAQNYLITFTGIGASASVSTVKVENLMKGTSLTLNGSDILRLTGPTGVNSIENKQSSELNIYPNPMIDFSTIEIFPPVAGDAIISVVDMTGRLVAQIKSYLENYLQEFRLSGINSGVYLISIKGKTYQYSGKLLCSGKADRTISLEKIISNQATNEKAEKKDFKGTQAIVDMAYTTGDRLKITGTSGNYSTVKIDIPASDKTISFNFIACTDRDNNNYPVVEIGTQVWMAENLKTTRYSNGDLVGTTSSPTLAIYGESTPKYQWASGGNESNVSTYGRLFTWYTVADSRNICPTGWHVPTDAQWTTLVTYLGGESVAGGKLKETGTIHWQNPNTGATNESGFSALAGGYRGNDGVFYLIGFFGYWWLASEYDFSTAWNRNLYYVYNSLKRSNDNKQGGFAVRCVKD